MKRLFRKNQPERISSPPPVVPPDYPAPQAVANSALAVGLQPKFTVPPVPHPTPYHRLATLATKNGLLFRPVIPSGVLPESHIRIPWGDSIQIDEIDGSGNDSGVDWESAAIIFGILGTLKLNSGMYP